MKRIPLIDELSYLGPGRCSALLRWPDDPKPVATTFTVDRSDDVATVRAEPEFAMSCRGSAEDIRQLYQLVAAFVAQAGGGLGD